MCRVLLLTVMQSAVPHQLPSFHVPGQLLQAPVFQVCITHPAFRKMYLLANASILLQGGLDDAHQPGMIFPQAPRKNSLGLHRLVRVALLRSCGIAEIICHCANEIKKT